jgi:hypothetical protein
MPHALQSKDDWREAHKELQALVDAWDPVGLLATGAPSEEYECLVWPLMQRLDGGAGAEELAHWLREDIVRHFGVPAPPDLEIFSRRAAAAFLARGGVPPNPERA